MSSESVSIRVNPPCIEHDTVRFTWQCDPPQPDPPDGGLFFRYEGLDVSAISVELWMEIFLALRLGSFKRWHEHVVVHLPVALPQVVVDYWRTYHDAKSLEIQPVATGDAYEPLVGPASPALQQFDAGVFFGGGRESLATSCLLGEIYGRHNVLLIQCVDPHHGGEEVRQQEAKRQELLSFAPAESVLGFATQRVWTNLHRVAFSEGGKPNEPHLEQYTAGLLPVLLLRDVKLSTPGYPWLEFVIHTGGERPVFRYPRSRPESLAAQSCHLQRTSGIAHTYANVCMALSGSTAFHLLARRYRDAFPLIMSCVAGGEKVRWCQECRNCARYAWHCLEEGVAASDCSIDHVLSTSNWSHRYLNAVEGLAPPIAGSNAPYTSGWSATHGYAQWCQSYHRADPAYLQSNLSLDGWFNSMLMQAYYGNCAFPAYGMVPSPALDSLPDQLSNSLRSILEQHFAIVASLPDPLLAGEEQVLEPFALPFQHSLFDLPHLQPVS